MKSIFISLTFIILSLNMGFAEEIISTKDGRLIRLNDDNTWEIVENNLTGKVVYTIVGVEDFLDEDEVEDALEGKKYFEYYVYCSITLKVENKTNHKVSSGTLHYRDDGSIGGTDGMYFQTKDDLHMISQFEDEVINPGGSSLSIPVEGIIGYTNYKKDKPLNAEEKEQAYKDFGCASHDGEIGLVISINNGHKFPKSAGISKLEMPSMFVSNPLGEISLKEFIDWVDYF